MEVRVGPPAGAQPAKQGHDLRALAALVGPARFVDGLEHDAFHVVVNGEDPRQRGVARVKPQPVELAQVCRAVAGALIRRTP